MKISLIVAAATNNVIGRDGELPWHLSEDLKRFKRLTIGKPIIMGRLTYESIGKPLPDRRNIVISSRQGLKIDGCEVVASPDAAIELTVDDEEVMVIGGGGVYAQMLPMADRIYLTRVHAAVDGDTYIPDLVEHKGPPGRAKKGLRPWFEVEDPAWKGTRIVFGHWSALGLIINPDLICVDTGCLWGRQLTAVHLGKRPRVTQVKCGG